MPITSADIERHYLILNRIGCLGDDPSSGFLRAAYSDEETSAMRHFETQGDSIGLQSRWDAAGNLVLEVSGQRPEFLEAASHVDTVSSGGNYDGTAGVVAGFEAIRDILRETPVPRCGLRLRIWRGEEFSTYKSVYTGSRAAFGILDPNVLSNVFRGKTLEQAMTEQCADCSALRRCDNLIPAIERDAIALHLELHIEQGNLLEVSGNDIGIVTGIRAARRFCVELYGNFDHSGATPLGIEYRKHVNLALGYILVRLDALAKETLSAGEDLVQTVGVINSDRELNDRFPDVYQNAVPKVSGFGYFLFEFRSVRRATLEHYKARSLEVIRSEAEKFGVKAKVEPIGSSEPLEEIDSGVIEVLESGCSDAGATYVLMPSGAGHDASVVGQQKRCDGSLIPAGMLFIPCLKGKSHCPEEYASFEAISRGAQVICAAFEARMKTFD